MSHLNHGRIPRPTGPLPSGELRTDTLPLHGYLAEWINTPLREAYALTFWKDNGLALRIVSLTCSWHCFLEQTIGNIYESRAESHDIHALHAWIWKHYPQATIPLWRPEPWNWHWRQNNLPTSGERSPLNIV